MLAFMAEDADSRGLSNVNGELGKNEQNDLIIRFVEFWKRFFFFLAEDGIRDRNVTGVQTCALPISVCFPAIPASLTIGDFVVSSNDCETKAQRPPISAKVSESFLPRSLNSRLFCWARAAFSLRSFMSGRILAYILLPVLTTFITADPMVTRTSRISATGMRQMSKYTTTITNLQQRWGQTTFVARYQVKI